MRGAWTRWGRGRTRGLVDRGFYFTALADFIRAAVPTVHGPGVRLPDVFDPRWPAAAEAHAAAGGGTLGGTARAGRLVHG